jgi:hypothetical protein
LYNTNVIKNLVQSKFKENLWCDKELEDKRKSRYHNEAINPNLEDQKYLFFFTSVKKIINIAKKRTNSHELHSKTGCWEIPQKLLNGANEFANMECGWF